jgi:cyanophycinase
MGYMVLEGGAEFGGRMAEPDLRALELAGGMTARVVVLPTAAAPDLNHRRAARNGVDWFTSLGATSVAVALVIDQSSANDAAIAAMLGQAQLIYILGGFPGYLNDTLRDSLCWRSTQEAIAGGGVIAGSSAGAMVLCEHLYDPQTGRMAKGLGMIPAVCVIPHHDRFGADWVGLLGPKLAGQTLLGIDEQTGAINDGPQGTWRVYGKGAVTVYHGRESRRFTAGDSFELR